MYKRQDPQSRKDIVDILDSGLVSYWTGKKGMEFEEKFAAWAGAKMAISCTNGTAALHIGISSLGIGPGDEVLVPSYSFIASSFAIVQAGAIPVFCDVTEDHTIDPEDMERKITPVSYTHLDVYKRQTLPGSEPSSRVFPRERQAFPLIPWANSPRRGFWS